MHTCTDNAKYIWYDKHKFKGCNKPYKEITIDFLSVVMTSRSYLNLHFKTKKLIFIL